MEGEMHPPAPCFLVSRQVVFMYDTNYNIIKSDDNIIHSLIISVTVKAIYDKLLVCIIENWKSI